MPRTIDISPITRPLIGSLAELLEPRESRRRRQLSESFRTLYEMAPALSQYGDKEASTALIKTMFTEELPYISRLFGSKPELLLPESEIQKLVPKTRSDIAREVYKIKAEEEPKLLEATETKRQELATRDLESRAKAVEESLRNSGYKDEDIARVRAQILSGINVPMTPEESARRKREISQEEELAVDPVLRDVTPYIMSTYSEMTARAKEAGEDPPTLFEAVMSREDIPISIRNAWVRRHQDMVATDMQLKRDISSSTAKRESIDKQWFMLLNTVAAKEEASEARRAAEAQRDVTMAERATKDLEDEIDSAYKEYLKTLEQKRASYNAGNPRTFTPEELASKGKVPGQVIPSITETPGYMTKEEFVSTSPELLSKYNRLQAEKARRQELMDRYFERRKSPISEFKTPPKTPPSLKDRIPLAKGEVLLRIKVREGDTTTYKHFKVKAKDVQRYLSMFPGAEIVDKGE